MIAIPVFFIYFKFVPQVKTADVIKANGGDKIKKESHKSAWLFASGLLCWINFYGCNVIYDHGY